MNNYFCRNHLVHSSFDNCSSILCWVFTKGMFDNSVDTHSWHTISDTKGTFFFHSFFFCHSIKYPMTDWLCVFCWDQHPFLYLLTVDNKSVFSATSANDCCYQHFLLFCYLQCQLFKLCLVCEGVAIYVLSCHPSTFCGSKCHKIPVVGNVILVL